MPQADAVARIQNFIGMLGVGGELEALDVVAMDQADFENVKKRLLPALSHSQNFLTALHTHKVLFPAFSIPH